MGLYRGSNFLDPPRGLGVRSRDDYRVDGFGRLSEVYVVFKVEYLGA